MITNIELADGDEIPEPNVMTRDGWWIDGKVVTIRSHTGTWVSTYDLPKGACVTMIRLGDGRSRLGIGGFTKTTVTVTGPAEAINRLRERVIR